MSVSKIFKNKKANKLETAGGQFNYNSDKEFYGVSGKLDNTLAEKEIFAKKITYPNTIQYWVLTDRYNRLVNPADSVTRDESIRKARQSGSEVYRFMKTSAAVFAYYLQFLQTKQKASLTKAQSII